MFVISILISVRSFYFFIRGFGGNLIALGFKRKEMMEGLCDVLNILCMITYIMRSFDNIFCGYIKYNEISKWSKGMRVRDSINVLTHNNPKYGGEYVLNKRINQISLRSKYQILFLP